MSHFDLKSFDTGVKAGSIFNFNLLSPVPFSRLIILHQMFVHDNKSFFKAISFTMEIINGTKVISVWSVFKVFFITNKLIGVKKKSHCSESILAIAFINFFFMCTFFLKILHISDMVIKQVGSTSKNYYRRKATITQHELPGTQLHNTKDLL